MAARTTGSSSAATASAVSTGPCPPPFPGECRGAGTRDTTTGFCVNPPLADGTACDDGNRSTIGDSCVAGTCIPGATVTPTSTGAVYARLVNLGSSEGRSFAHDINGNGDVVGVDTASPSFYDGAFVTRPFRWNEAQGFAYLPAAGPNAIPYDINDSGVVSGTGGLDLGEAWLRMFHFRPAVDPTFQTVGHGWGRKNNGGGVMIGSVYTSLGLQMVRTNGADSELLPLIPGSRFANIAFAEDIADDGTVVGQLLRGDYSAYTAARYTNARGMEALEDLLPTGSAWDLRSAKGVRDDRIVGWGYRGALGRAFRLDVNGDGAMAGIADLGMTAKYPTQTPNAVAIPRGLNRAGDIVGAIYDGSAYWPVDAFVHVEGAGMIDLNDLVDPTSGWHLTIAHGINDRREVVGFGHFNGDYHARRAFKMTLPPVLARPGRQSPITLRVDGVVDLGDGTFQAIFGYTNSSATAAQPTSNVLYRNGRVVPSPVPPLPTQFAPGGHPGAYAPTFNGTDTLTWEVDGQVAVASAHSPRVDCSTGGGAGAGVLGPACAITPRVEGVVTIAGKKHAVFSYENSGAQDVHLGYGPQNQLNVSGTVIAHPDVPPPSWFITGDHRGAFTPAFETASLTWKVGIRSVTASGTAQVLPPEVRDEGTGVVIHGVQFVVVVPNMAKHREAPPEPPLAADPFDSGNPAPWHGRLEGQLSVSPAGAATYTLPIALPPAIAGMAPNLSLVYNSQSGMGIAGQGWDLAGLSAIHRCPRQRGTDGVHRALDLGPLIGPGRNDEDTDGLCLDGQRLFLRSRDDSKAVYTFEAERSDASVITYHQSANRFEIVTKSGETRHYGWRRPVSLPEGTSFADVIWPLDRVVDTWGNYFDLVYNGGVADFAEKGLLLSDVLYTGHLAGAGHAGLSVFERVTFVYEVGAPTDPVRRARFRNAVLPRNRRLKTISTSAGVYTLDYRTDANGVHPPLLSSIGYCARGGAPCTEPLHFIWEGGEYGWDPAPGYAIPTTLVTTTSEEGWFFPRYVRRFSGSQFVDLDGDGRVDLVHMHGAHPRAGWRNSGSNWEAMPSTWFPPGNLVFANGQPTGGTFAEVNGDGRIDFVDGRDVFVNRIRPGLPPDASSGWTKNVALTLPEDISDRNILADMDGDGRSDFVIGAFDDEFRVFINHGGSGWVEDSSYAPSWAKPAKDFRVADVNGDGLPDLVGHIGSSSVDVALNMGSTARGEGGTVFARRTMPNNVLNNPDKRDPQESLPSKNLQFGDVDGDGTTDVAHFYETLQSAPGGTPRREPHWSVVLGNGFGGDDSTALAQQYTASFTSLAFKHLLDLNGDGMADGIGHDQSFNVNLGTGWRKVPNAQPLPLSLNPDGGTAVVDLNGDGVLDLAFGNSLTTPGQAFISRYRRPVINKFWKGRLTPLPRGTFTGLSYVSLSEGAAQAPAGALPAVYEETALPLAGINPPGRPKPAIMPLDVVKSVDGDDGIGGRSVTTYHYANMRVVVARRGGGVRGFEKVTSIDPAGIRTETRYAHFFPYVGMPIRVVRSSQNPATGQPTGPLSETETQYCHTTATNLVCAPASSEGGASEELYSPGRSSFVVPRKIIETTHLRTSSTPEPIPAERIVTTTEFVYDGDERRNPHRTTVTMERFRDCTSEAHDSCESLEKRQTVTESDYGAVGSPEQRMGKPIATVVRSSVLAPAGSPELDRIRRTEFRYANVSSHQPVPAAPGQPPVQALALVKTMVEPGGGADVEQHIVYAYDPFGNVVTTTSCASELSQCVPGATGPAALPYRTTEVSFDPEDFTPVTGPAVPGLISTLSYGPGRYPVRTTNAAHHTEYTAYDPRFGKLVQQTGPNGIHTCSIYDGLGELKQEVARCGSAAPIVTTMDRYMVLPSQAPPRSFTVTVRRSPGGERAWTFADVLGRTVASWSRGFDRLVEVRTEYNHLGQLERVSKPAFVSSAAPEDWSTSAYDALGRPRFLTEPLGVIDASGVKKTAFVITTYQGSAVATTRVVAGSVRTQTETKNVLGKLESVTDAQGGVITYAYDADGNLTTTTDSAGNSTRIDYDVRGRKVGSIDPDMGLWTYRYNAFGDLVSQLDGKRQETVMGHDVLGRMIRKTDAAGTRQWVYDLAPGGGKGKLAAEVGAPDPLLLGQCAVPHVDASTQYGVGRWFEYDAFGQLLEAHECIDEETHQTSYRYDGQGRQRQVIYPQVQATRLTLQQHFTQAGYLHYVTDAGDGGIYWAATAMNALGQVTTARTRNGVETKEDRNPVTGWLMGSTSHARADKDRLIQSWGYGFDEAGSLRRRGRNDRVNAADTEETFGYDKLDRLASAHVLSAGVDTTESYDYDALGNLTSKDGKPYTYGGCGAGPHAVCTVDGGAALVYDANGSMLTGLGRTVQYKPNNKPARIARGGNTVDFVYGAEDERVLQVAAGGPDGEARTVYVGMNATGTSLYERTVRSGRVEHVQFLYAGGSAIALRVTEGEGPVTTAPPSTKYYHRDHLGSVTAMSDEFGRVVDSTLGSRSPDVLGYDAWGARRAPEGAPIDESTVDEPVGRRGYTGHETISDVGLVNMNGRVYDPALGRFLSADPHVQFITNLQSYNRYSYVLNNPLRYTDPTGYASFLQEVSYVIGAASPVLLPVMGLVACVAAPGAGCLAAGLMITAANAAMQAASGAALDQVLIGAGISTAAGLISGGIAGQAVSSLANGPGKALLAGAISGGLSGAITTVAASALGGDLSMKQLAINVLVGAATGALSAAATYATSSEAKVTQASVDGQGMGEADEAWGGWGSREKYSKAIFAGEEMDFLASASPGSEPVAGFKGKVVQLLENGGTRTVRALKDFKDAVSVRRSGGNVLVDTRQHAKQVEGAAHGTQDMLRHNGHSLPNNQRGMPHYQTQGVKGHSFWSKVNGGVILFFDSVLDLLNPFDAIETKAGCAALRGC